MEEEEIDSKAAVAGQEKKALVEKHPEALSVDESVGDVYSTRKFVGALSFKVGLIASFVVLMVLIIIVAIVAGVITANSKKKSKAELNVLTLDDVFDANLTARVYPGSWVGDRLVAMSKDTGVTTYQPSTQLETVLITPEQLDILNNQLYGVSKVIVSPSFFSESGNQLMLLVANSQTVYRHSALSDCYFYSQELQDKRNVSKPEGLSEAQFQYIAWSPNGQWVAYVIENNVYLLNASLEEATPIAITTGGSKTGTIYGRSDWLYEEEIFSTDSALWWSPDSEKLMFAAFNETEVEVYSFPKYGNMDQQYDTIETIPYPKPGTNIPVVTMYVTDIGQTQPNRVALAPGTLAYMPIYVSYAGWINSSHAYVAWLSRRQNDIEFCSYSSFEGDTVDCDGIIEMDIVGERWREQYSASNVQLYTNEDRIYVLTLTGRETGQDSSTHLAVIPSGESPDFLTGPGLWEVTDIVGRHDNLVLYMSTEEGFSKRHLYSVDRMSLETHCLSCNQTTWGIPQSPNPSIPDTCEYFTASCDATLSHCLLHCRGPCVPYSVLARYDQQTHQLLDVKIMEVNAALRDGITPLDLPTRQFFTIPEDAEGNPELNGRMLLPPGFDNSKQYPVLVFLYGGPNSQVVDETSILLSLSHIFYVSNLSIILASVDGRGTGYHGDKFKFSVYKNLGHYETLDQVRAGRDYYQKLPYVDGSKLAIYGSSYGGYMAAMVGSSGSGVFSAAISQSPVSDWHYYDSAYTERYMVLPNENENYETSSVLRRAERLADVDFLLIHGTGDDNVHFQHTTQLAEALTQADVQFRMQVYTDKAHSLTGGNTRRHLYQLISDFLRDTFQLS